MCGKRSDLPRQLLGALVSGTGIGSIRYRSGPFRNSGGQKFLEVPSGKALVGQMFDVAYRVVGLEDQWVTVSTTRPETILGDVAVAVHPDDPRYADLLNRSVRLQHPLRTDTLPLVADSQGVDPKIGTGAVKITPCHDPNDFDVSQRLGLPAITMLNEEGLVCFPTESHFQLTSDGESFLVSRGHRKLDGQTGFPKITKCHFFSR